jgi:2-keto-4-pentenoate hydratase/2-oxohepta-3-ene-1,7-dioic acid hydratase in catechol pathway
VIEKTGKNISKENALDYIAGYVASNDVSARTWQRDPAYAGGVPQWCFSKGFDKYAPLGPMIISLVVVGDASKLRLQTWVNNELRQGTETSDLLSGVREIVSFISQGTTLEQGTVFKVTIEHLGSVRNKMAWE